MKRIVCIVMLIMMISTMLNTFALEYGTDIAPNDVVYQQKFSDVPKSYWAFKYIAELVERGAISGYPDGRYYPNNTVTRVQFAKIMVMAAGLSPKTGIETGYADVPLQHWGAPYVSVAKSYMTAYQQNGAYVFKPDTPALREDIAVAVVTLKGYDINIADMDMLKTMFSDYDSISLAIRPYIAVAVEKGIISGYPDGTFRGQNSVTRAEAAAILWRAFQFGNDNKVVLPTGTNQAQSQTQLPTQNQSETQMTQEKNTDNNEATADEQFVQGETKTEIQQKPYATETISSLPKNTDDMVFTKSGDIYYIKDKKLCKLSNGKTTELYDSASDDYYEEVTFGELMSDFNDSGDFYNEDMLLYFDSLELVSLAYCKENDKVYVSARTNIVENISSLSTYVYIRKICEAENIGNCVYNEGMLEWNTMGTQIKDPDMKCVNGNILYDNLKIDVKKGTSVEYIRVEDKNYFQVNSVLHRIAKSGIERYDLLSGNWIAVNLADNNISSATAFCENDGKIYFSANKEIYYFENAGTNRFKSVKYISLNDIEITDDMPLLKMADILFDNDGNILFLDTDHGVLRKLIKR